MKPTFHFLTLFPEVISPWLRTSIVGKAYDQGLFDFKVHQLRDFSDPPHYRVDDQAYGGGGGMVLKIEPLVRGIEAIRAEYPQTQFKICAFVPAGKPLTQKYLAQLSTEANFEGICHWILVCGHYEGIDERFLHGFVHERICVGDVVVTGGELPALFFADAMIRHIEGALGHPDGCKHESFLIESHGHEALLEYPHYTRPAEFRDFTVPKVLLSGDHRAISEWRGAQAFEVTKSYRPKALGLEMGRESVD